MVLMLPITLIFLWLESTQTVLPLLLIALTVMIVLYKEIWVFSLAFIGGLILDSITVRPLGSTSIFFVSWLFLILLYERKYQIDSYLFICAATFFGVLLFLTIFKYDNVFIQSITGAGIALILFFIARRLTTVKNKNKTAKNFEM